MRRGIGLSIPRSRYDEVRAVEALGRLLNEPSFAAGAAGVGEEVRAEHGADKAAVAIEQVLAEGHLPLE